MSLTVTRHRLVSRGQIPGSDGGIYNPGAVLRGTSILMVCRREIDYRFTTDVHPEIVLVDPRTLAVAGHRTLGKGAYPAGCRIEDFRTLEHEGTLLVVHNIVDAGKIKPMLSRVVGDRLQPFDDLDLPIPTGRVEKNWVLFVRVGILHCLYKLDPLTVFRRIRHRRWELVKEDENGWSGDFARPLSNSANLIPFRGGYLGFWHTILDHRYVQGAVFLDADLEIRYRTGILLDGAEIRDGFKPGVLYVSSLVAHEGRILAFFGEADAHTSVAIFDADALWDELVRSPFRPAEALRVRYDGSSTGDLFRVMRTLQTLSETEARRRIHLYVPDVRLRPMIDMFKIPGLSVYAHGRERRYDVELDGRRAGA